MSAEDARRVRAHWAQLRAQGVGEVRQEPDGSQAVRGYDGEWHPALSGGLVYRLPGMWVYLPDAYEEVSPGRFALRDDVRR